MPPFTYKRKRNGGYGGTQTYTPRLAKRGRFAAPRRAPFRPGVDRTGGFYGRFSGRQGELKFHDVDLDDAVIAQNIQITPSINLIAQGVTESTRVGRKCTVKSINWHYNLMLPNVGNVGAADVVRVVLYVDKQCNGATATATGIFESDDYQSFRNLANSGRFQVLMDRTHAIGRKSAAGNGTANDAPSEEFQYSFYKRCNIPLEFDNTTGAITEIRSNNIGVALISKSGVESGFFSKFRLRFSDGS